MKRPIVIIGFGVLLLLVLITAVYGNRVISDGKTSNTVESVVTPKPTSPADYDNSWLAINGGGDIMASSASYRLGISIGQPVAGNAIGQNFRASLGFWYCDCGIKGDMNGDRSADPLDVVYLVNCVYKQQCALVEPVNCPFPYPVGDLECNGDITPLDVTILVNFVYRQLDSICFEDCM